MYDAPTIRDPGDGNYVFGGTVDFSHILLEVSDGIFEFLDYVCVLSIVSAVPCLLRLDHNLRQVLVVMSPFQNICAVEFKDALSSLRMPLFQFFQAESTSEA